MSSPQHSFQATSGECDDLRSESGDGGEPNVLESGETDVPPSLPPPLTPQLPDPHQHSPGNHELQYLIHYLQVTHMSDEQKRQEDEEARRAELQAFRLQMQQQRDLDNQRFMHLLSLVVPQPSTATTSPQQTQQPSQIAPQPGPQPAHAQHIFTPGQEVPAAPQLLPPTSSRPSPLSTPAAPFTSKPTIASPPQLQADVTYQLFRQWRRMFEDYAALMGLYSLPPATQHIYLRTCISLEVQRLLHHTLAIPPDSSTPVHHVLDILQRHFRNVQNEALRRRELLSCKQATGESFSAFYSRLKDLADEVDLCTGDPTTCAAAQIKMILLMGIREEELVQRLVSLDSHTSLDDFVTCCRTFESSRAAASAISAAPSQLNVVSTYKRNQRRQKTPATTTPQRQQSPISTDVPSTAFCRSCTRQHAKDNCPARDNTCSNCGYKGHWPRTPRCPAMDSDCNACHKKGHFARCCHSSGKTSTTLLNSSGPSSPPSSRKATK